MSDIAIRIENLSKSYRIGEIGTGTLSHDLNRAWARMRGKEDPYAKVGTVNDRTQKAEKGEIISALKDINLEVKKGEVLGIIGKNGAGKSTLLKILSRVTSPTIGRIKINGRIASLLEVGTGFHPEMTGRENIYMNGTIMGMRKWEIDKKLDEIVDFAGVAKYLDTPTKRYSSGMTVRLGFAIAAFLEPEILVVDEVLAVGDAEFQKKAIGKMQDISSGEGRTVLFVSHNMASVQNLCSKALILENGKKIKEGNSPDVVDHYLSRGKATNSQGQYLRKNSISSNDSFYIESISVSSSLEKYIPIISGGNCYFKITLNSHEIVNASIRISVFNEKNELLFICNNFQSSKEFKLSEGKINVICLVEDLPLYEGSYRVDVLSLNNRVPVESIENALSFEVSESDFFKTGKISRNKLGMVLMRNKWILVEQ